MSFTKFFEKDTQQSYPIKILVYPNITYMQDLEKDSYVVVLRNVIKELNEVRDDLHWTIISPSEIQSLIFPNTKQLLLPMPSYPNAMRTHFDFTRIKKLIDWKNNDYDILYSHLPEHTAQLVNLFHNNTNIIPKVVGYCHWYEVPENTAYNKTMLMANFAGMLEMEECGVNSVWLKNLVLEKAKKYLSSDLVAKLDKIIQPHYLGVDKIDLSNNPTGNNIIFNHRDNEYTQYKWFLQQMDKLYEKRQDFTVYTTLADINKPYGKRVKIHDRQDYLKFLKSMKVGVGCFSKYSAWSIATTDSLSMGVPYVLPNKLCYPEMVGEDYKLLYDDAKDFLDKIEMMLDDKIEVDLSKKIKSFTWKKRVAEWFDKWKCFDEFDCVQETESYQKIKQFIIDNNSVSKKDILDYMGWGVRIGFNGYRNRLRTEPDITFTQNRYELKR